MPVPQHQARLLLQRLKNAALPQMSNRRFGLCLLVLILNPQTALNNLNQPNPTIANLFIRIPIAIPQVLQSLTFSRLQALQQSFQSSSRELKQQTAVPKCMVKSIRRVRRQLAAVLAVLEVPKHGCVG